MRKTSFIDPVDLAAVANLELLARTVVAGLKSGIHHSARTGGTAEFAQYRPYAQGDDPRFVDWRVYGRSDRLHIRQFREETNLHLTVLLDISASMDYGSGPVDKFSYARMLAACLIVLAHNQRDHIGFAAYHSELATYIPARARADQLARVLTALGDLHPAGHSNAAQALHFVGDVLPPRGMVVLISDLLHPLGSVRK